MYGNVDAGQNDDAAAAAAVVGLLTDDKCDNVEDAAAAADVELLAALLDVRIEVFMAVLLEGTSTSPEAELVEVACDCPVELVVADAAVAAAAVLLELPTDVDDVDALLVLVLLLAAFAFLAAFFFFDLDDVLRWDDAFPPVSTHITYNFDFIYLGLFTLVTVHKIKHAYLGNYLQYLARFECGAGQKDNWARHVTSFNAEHVRVFIITEIGCFAGFVHPRIPNH